MAIDDARPLDPREQVHMMRSASAEIKALRRANQEMAPSARAFDAICRILDLTQERGQGMGEDMAWHLDRSADSVEAFIASAAGSPSTKGD